MSRSAIVGGILWTGLAAGSALGLLRLGTIELLFLLAPLVVVPLGLELSGQLGDDEEGSSDVINRGAVREHRASGAEAPRVRCSVMSRLKPRPPITAHEISPSLVRWIQLTAAFCAMASFWFAPGRVAAILALPWFGFGCLMGFLGLARLARGAFKSFKAVCVVVAFLYLPVGCAWLVASRRGLTPMGFQEPIVLLTAVHFHFAGFAAPLLTRATAATLEKASVPTQRLFQFVATGVLAGPGVLAAGFVIGPRLKLAAALLLASSEIGLAVFFLAAVRAMRPRLAQAFVALSAASLLFAMVLAGVWAVGEFPLQPFVHLAEMARFHGTANAFGFTVCGLLGWTPAARGAASGKGGAQ